MKNGLHLVPLPTFITKKKEEEDFEINIFMAQTSNLYLVISSVNQITSTKKVFKLITTIII